MKKPFIWDSYSDQPAQLKNKEFKRTMRKKNIFSLITTFVGAIIFLPISLVTIPFTKYKKIKSKDFFSIGIDFEKEPEESLNAIKELGVTRVLLRLKLWEMDKLDQLESFIEKLPDIKITLKILQDREHIEDHDLLKQDLSKIFQKFKNKVDYFEIGSTINRAKWGFFSVNEYLNFFQVAYILKKEQYQDIKLMGGGVIDFEYHYTLHTLYNLVSYHYDAYSALLYVDRRGAPENTQLGFSLSDKIAWLSALVSFSPKSYNKLHITEVNWPLKGTKPYAPTSDYECVSEEEYENYMLRYHFLALASQQINSLTWHQLIAPGYGLIDNRETFKKRPAFFVYKEMVNRIKNAQFLRLDIKRNYYIFQVLIEGKLLQIHWSLKDTTLKNESYFEIYNKYGEKVNDEQLTITQAPLYIYIHNASGKKTNCL